MLRMDWKMCMRLYHICIVYYLHAALAGNALIIAGPIPLNNALLPSSRINVLYTSITPVYLPSGAVCSLDFNTSAGIAIAQFAMPIVDKMNVMYTHKQHFTMCQYELIYICEIYVSIE
jgi:hypothetical protein